MDNIAAITVAWAQNQNLKACFQGSVTSTNDLAREENAADLYVCEHQSAGRGRGTNTWSDSGSGQLLASWNWKPTAPAAPQLLSTPQPMITPRLGLALFRAASATWSHTDWSLKAPNDLFLGERKIAGLLVEAVTQGDNVRIVIGLGMNVSKKPTLNTAGSLADYFSPSILTERSLRDFLSRWQLEMKLVCDSPGGELAAHDRVRLAEALRKNPLSPRVVELNDDGTIRYENGNSKNWMEL